MSHDTNTKTSEALLEALRTHIDGQVLTAGDAGYDAARTPHFPARVGTPVAVVRPKHSGDVAATVDIARRERCPLFVRNGGHSAASHSTGDGILLDLSSLTGIEIDVPGRTAWAETGLTTGAVARALAPHGLAIGFGDTGSVGIGGITLGGGIGFLSRLHGMTIDNVLAAEIVTADGRLRIVDDQHEPDLFWAIRGGGGNFGVVTRFRFRLAEVPQVYGGPLILPATPATIAGLADACVDAGDALSVIANVMPAPPMPNIPEAVHGQTVILALVCYAGEPEAAEEALTPLRRIAEPALDLLQPMPYAALFEQEAPSKGQAVAVRNIFVDRVDEQVGATILEHLSRSDAWLRSVQFRVLGGAIDRVPADQTAYAHRGAPVMVNVVHGVEGGNEAAAREWVERLAGALHQGIDGSYVNFFGPGDADRIQAAYPGETLSRLRRIKAEYDPANMFRHNENIRPGAEP